MPDSTDEQRTHWEAVYRTKAATETFWYQPILQRSLELIQAAAVPPGAAILDVGGGASTLVDHLLAAAFTDVTVLDISLDHCSPPVNESSGRGAAGRG